MKTQKLLSLALVLVMVLALLPTTALAGGMGEAPDHEIWIYVGEEGDDPEIKIDVATGENQSGDGWSWNGTTKTLRLENFTGTWMDFGGCGDVTLELAGSNSLSGSNGLWLDDFRGPCHVTIKGDGTLTTNHVWVMNYGDNSLTIESGTLKVTASSDDSDSINLNGTFTVRGGTVSASGGSTGVIIQGGTLMVRGGSLSVSGSEYGIKVAERGKDAAGGNFKAIAGRITLEGGVAALAATDTWSVKDGPYSGGVRRDPFYLFPIGEIVGGETSADAALLEEKEQLKTADAADRNGEWWSTSVIALSEGELTLSTDPDESRVAFSGAAKYATMYRDPSTVRQQGTPTDLRWEEEESGDIPGRVRWKCVDPYLGMFTVAFYREGTPKAVIRETWSVGTSMPWNASATSFRNEANELESGSYYFTVTPIDDGTTYAGSEAARSDYWFFDKAETHLNVPDAPVWTAGGAVQLPAFSDAYFDGFEVGLLVSDTEESATDAATLKSKLSKSGSANETLKMIPSGNLGDGRYYYVRIRALSNDITENLNSEWSALSAAYHNTDETPADPQPTTKKLTKSMFTVDTSEETYTGSAITKSVTGRDGDKTLVEGTDYTVAYANNVNVGTAKFTITGKGSYAGALTYTFTIKAKSTGGSGTGSGTGGGTGGGSTTPTTPTEPVTPVEPEKPTEPEKTDPTAGRFTDVAKGSWYEAGVTYVTDKGLFQGVGKDTFAPNGTMTRAMIFTVLARLDGQDTSGGDIWNRKGMDWAVAQGISDGSNPQSPMTREQLATMLYRYAKPEEAKGELSKFTDADAVSEWARPAMEWAVANGIVTGVGGGRLAPRGTATRAQVAAMLMRFCGLTKAE